MDIEVINVTKAYKKDFKTKKITSAIFYALITLSLLIFCLIPIGKIEDYAIENSFQLIIGFINTIIDKEKNSFSYLTYFNILSLTVILSTVLFIIAIISSLNAKIDEPKMFIDKKYENMKISFKYIFKQFIWLLIFTCLCVFILIPTNLTAERYGFTFDLNWCIILFFVLWWLKIVACNYITLKYDEKGSFSKQEIFDKNKKTTKEDKLTSKNRKNQKNGNSKIDIFSKTIVILLVFVYIFLGALFSVFLAFSYYNSMFGGYNFMGYNSVAGWVISPDDENLLRFDVKTLYEGVNGRLVCDEGFGDYYIGLEYKNGVLESNTKSFTFYGESYRYNKLKIEELTKQRNDLMPEDDSESALKKYVKKVEKMSKAIETLKDKRYYPYEYVNFVDGYMVDLQYNATGKSGIKWGAERDNSLSILFQEKISLTDRYCKYSKSMDKFPVGTNFLEELIVARVQYNDGSVRISKITPTNIEELNNATAGKYLLKWADSWGEYETSIILYD